MKYGGPKDIYRIRELREIPSVESTWLGIPELELLPDSSDAMPLLIDRQHYGKVYRVEDHGMYTIRLGIHRDPNGTGVFTKESTGVCAVPRETAKRLKLIGLFAPPELYPAVFLDSIVLVADEPFHIELVHGSVRLECNGEAETIPLSDEAVSADAAKDDVITISHRELKNKLPDYYTYTYDFIVFQVQVKFEDECMLEEKVQMADEVSEMWLDSVTAKVGNCIKFRIRHTNDSDVTKENVIIKDDLPPCLRYIEGTATIHSSQNIAERHIDADAIFTTGLKIETIEPGETIYVDYVAEMIESAPDEEHDRVWSWVEMCIGTKIFRDYAEVISAE